MRTAPRAAMTVYGVFAASLFAACAAVPTPLYPIYQQDFGLEPVHVTVVFSIYVASLLVALLCGGRLSDHLGRKPVIAAALLLNLAAILCFIFADSLPDLLLARIVQGFGMGIAIPTCGAAIIDADPARGPALNSVTPFYGMACGGIVTGVLVSYAPMPTLVPYLVTATLTTATLATLAFMPETVSRKAGALASLVPSFAIPPVAREPFVRLAPTVFAGWALGGLFMSLMPTILRHVLHSESRMLSGVVVFALFASAAAGVNFARTRDARAMMVRGGLTMLAGMVLTITGIEIGNVVFIFAGTILTGAGQGFAFSSSMRLLLPLVKEHERAGMLAVFFALSYMAFAVPAIIAGMAAPHIGLARTALWYGVGTGLLLVMSLVAMTRTPQPKRC